MRILTVTLLLTFLCLALQGPVSVLHAQSAEPEEWFTNLPLITHRGETIHFYHDMLAGKIVVVTGFYTYCKTVSPRQNEMLKRLQKRIGEQMGKEIFFVSVSVDPQRDTADRLKKFARAYKPGPGWTFLTGKPENVDWVNFKLGQYHEIPEEHKGTILLGNLNTGLWKKLSVASTADQLFLQIQNALTDQLASR